MSRGLVAVWIAVAILAAAIGGLGWMGKRELARKADFESKLSGGVEDEGPFYDLYTGERVPTPAEVERAKAARLDRIEARLTELERRVSH